MNPSEQLAEIKRQNYIKCKSRMGVATESNYSILKLNSSNKNVQSKIVTRPEKTSYNDPNAVTPFERNLKTFFDSSDAQQRLFK